MKITKRQLRRIIKEELVRLDESAKVVSLNTRPSPAAVNAAWPEGVYLNGSKVIDTVYSSAATGTQMEYLRSSGYDDAQENYLGYDPESGDFVMGFDAFEEVYDEYGNSDNDGMMQSVLLLVSPEGRPLEIITVVPDIFYPSGLRAAHTAFPQLINVRLD